MSTGAAWASAVLIKGKEDPYIVSSIFSCLSELGHSNVIIRSDGEPASEVVTRMGKSKGATMEKPPCEIIQQQSQRYSRATEVQNGWYKPYATRSKRTKLKLRRTQESPSKTTGLYSLGYHDTQRGNTRDSTNDKTQQQQHTRRSDACLTKTQ